MWRNRGTKRTREEGNDEEEEQPHEVQRKSEENIPPTDWAKVWQRPKHDKTPTQGRQILFGNDEWEITAQANERIQAQAKGWEKKEHGGNNRSRQIQT